MNLLSTKPDDGKLSRSEAGKLGFIASQETLRLLKLKRIEKYNTNPKVCKNCSSILSYDDSINKKRFCHQSCAAIFYNRRRQALIPLSKCLHCQATCKKSYCSVACSKHAKFKARILDWQAGNNKGWDGKTVHLKPFIRKFLFEKYSHKCSQCSWGKVHPITGKIPLEVNHIDGDATNCKESNLELICPNCHSLTPNFRALNKNSKRQRNEPKVGLAPTLKFP